MIKDKMKFGVIVMTAMVLGLSACKKDKALPEAEENELITKVSLTFTNVANASDVTTVSWTDPDGEGGAAPTIGSLDLKANAAYRFEVSEVLNETAKDADDRDVLKEIKEESDEHLWVYKPNVGLNINLVRTDKDMNGVQIGIMGTATTGAASIGVLQLTLRHQPSGKDGTEAPGSTDFEAVFPVVIK